MTFLQKCIKNGYVNDFLFYSHFVAEMGPWCAHHVRPKSSGSDCVPEFVVCHRGLRRITETGQRGEVQSGGLPLGSVSQSEQEEKCAQRRGCQRHYRGLWRI